MRKVGLVATAWVILGMAFVRVERVVVATAWVIHGPAVELAGHSGEAIVEETLGTVLKSTLDMMTMMMMSRT
jgi:hypothetical protein